MRGASESDYTEFGTLKAAREVPEVLDVLIAGGGPGGTAAAMRATELGLACLVIDRDDLMSRIRDYEQHKLIHPDYAGDDSPFPSGTPMIDALHFADIDKDDMVAEWRRKYSQFKIPAKIGTELTGIVQQPDKTFEVKTWNQRAEKEIVCRARSVILAIGAGRARTFEIPGDLDGIAFRLDDAGRHVGAPALVIGGGTSATEAVIAISNAKKTAGDATAVYWSYRKQQMPRVERNLSSAFFDAYVGSGNVRYLPWSEPILVLKGPDRKEYLSVRIDRKTVEGRPVESVHLEFPKEQVVACIGSDVPHQTVQRFGVKVPTVDGEPFMLVTEDGETSLAGVFLVGDVKGTPEYCRCTDFNAPATYRKVRDSRNIKTAMRDAVRAVEVIARRLGKLQAGAPAAAPLAPPVERPRIETPAAAPPPVSAPQLVNLLPDGSPGTSYPLKAETTNIGRKADGIAFDDPYMADQHAAIAKQDGGYVLSDTGQGSGVWMRVRSDGRKLMAGDQLWLGAQFLRAVEETGRWGIEHYNRKGEYQNVYWVGDKGAIVGRAGDVSLDAQDRSLSRNHAQFSVDGNVLQVKDLGSTNGTYVKLTAPAPLANGDEFRLATRHLRFESLAAEEPLRADVSVLDVPLPAPAAVSPEPQKPAAEGPVATIEDAKHPVTLAVATDEDVLHAHFEHLKAQDPEVEKRRCPADPSKKRRCPDDHYNEPLNWQCEVGECGLCAVQILAGAENFLPSPNAEKEKRTLKEMRRLAADLSKYRLACFARINGPVTVKVVPRS